MWVMRDAFPGQAVVNSCALKTISTAKRPLDTNGAAAIRHIHVIVSKPLHKPMNAEEGFDTVPFPERTRGGRRKNPVA
jgi:hypothetical protein